ncbi:MAG: hypothetical protein JW995_16220 [Melioribacteraceae bacterium]|nr:hypothetical protein [Melioribacteraceae bacterium]
MKRYIISSLVILFIIAFCNSRAQIIEENWVPVSYNNNLVYLDLSNIKSFTGDEIYVWTLEKHNPSLEIDVVNNEISATKTYYLISKSLMKYSIKEIIYYDEGNNVIRDFNYEYDSDDPEYRYSLPIFKNSLVDLILNRCLREIEGD